MIIQAKKIKIAFFLPSLEPGGTERNVVNLLKALDKEKYKLFLVLGKKKGAFIKEVPPEIPIITFGSTNFLKVFFRLVSYFKNQSPDFFISAFPHFNIISIGAKIFSKTQTKIIITEQTPFSFFPLHAKNLFRKLFARFFLPFLVRVFYPKAGGIICVSQRVADELSGILGSTAKIRVIYNPVIEEKIYKMAEEPIEHPWFYDATLPIILSVGRITKIKDLTLLLSAFSLVLKSQPARLVILGEGEEASSLKTFSEGLGLSEKVAFLGFQKNPYKFMKRASVFVLSSKLEGFSNVIVEAMACGLPVVCTNCVGPSEIIEDKKNGILIPVGDKKRLAEAILKIFKNPSFRKELAKEAEKRAQDFSIDKKTREYEEFISGLFFVPR